MGKTQHEILDKETIEAIKKEFPGDPALQQIHLARRRIVETAKAQGMSLLEYIQKTRPGKTD